MKVEQLPPVGSLVLLRDPHPAAGHVGRVARHDKFGGMPTFVVTIDAMGGHECGVVQSTEFEVVVEEPEADE